MIVVKWSIPCSAFLSGTVNGLFGVVMPSHDGAFFEPFGGCGADDCFPIPSVKGEYGAAIACDGALAPDCVRGGSGCPGHFFCSSCSLLSGSPTMWYFSQLMGGQRTIF